MSKKHQLLPTTLSHYHPIRYAVARTDFIDKATQALIADCGSDTNVVFNLSLQGAENSFNCFSNGRKKHVQSSLSSEAYPVYIRKVYEFAKKCYFTGEQKQYNYVVDCIEGMNDDDYLTFMQYASLILNGNNIFDFTNELLQLFAETNVNNVLLQDICLPFSTIYLHFGKQEGKKVLGNIDALIEFLIQEASPTLQNDIFFFLDGAYISQCPSHCFPPINLWFSI